MGVFPISTHRDWQSEHCHDWMTDAWCFIGSDQSPMEEKVEIFAFYGKIWVVYISDYITINNPNKNVGGGYLLYPKIVGYTPVI